MCKTRWVARIDALEVFFPAVIQTLEVMKSTEVLNQIQNLVNYVQTSYRVKAMEI
jgi:hypothetical protein